MPNRIFRKFTEQAQNAINTSKENEVNQQRVACMAWWNNLTLAQRVACMAMAEFE